MPTIMKRIFDKPMPKEIGSFDHFRAHQRSKQAREMDPHPVEVFLACAMGFSALVTAVCVVISVFQAMAESVPAGEVEKVLSVLFWSVCGLLGSTGLFLIWSRFVRHG
jgi:hypothetical protein